MSETAYRVFLCLTAAPWIIGAAFAAWDAITKEPEE